MWLTELSVPVSLSLLSIPWTCQPQSTPHHVPRQECCNIIGREKPGCHKALSSCFSEIMCADSRKLRVQLVTFYLAGFLFCFFVTPCGQGFDSVTSLLPVLGYAFVFIARPKTVAHVKDPKSTFHSEKA